MKNTCLTALLLLTWISCFSQQADFSVFGTLTNPYAGPFGGLVTLDTLQKTETLGDLYARYRANWVAQYLAVEVATDCNGNIKSAESADDRLSSAQLELLREAALGCTINVTVDYIPDNQLTHNPPRQMNFSLTVVPIFEAKYPGGKEQLDAYLTANIMNKVPVAALAAVALAQVRFTINEEGQAIDTRITQSSGSEQVDQLMLDALCNMPEWTPAKNAEGAAVQQEFEFRLGTDLLRCDYQY